MSTQAARIAVEKMKQDKMEAQEHVTTADAFAKAASAANTKATTMAGVRAKNANKASYQAEAATKTSEAGPKSHTAASGVNEAVRTDQARAATAKLHAEAAAGAQAKEVTKERTNGAKATAEAHQAKEASADIDKQQKTYDHATAAVVKASKDAAKEEEMAKALEAKAAKLDSAKAEPKADLKAASHSR